MKNCRYKRFCKTANKHCSAEEEDGCTLAMIKSESICPIMAATDTPEKNCGCDIPHIRKLWPTGKKCFSGNECLPRNYAPVQQQISHLTDQSAIAAAFAAA